MQLQLHLDRPPPFGSGQRQAVEQVHARDKVERVGERAGNHLGLQPVLAQHHGRGVPMETVGQQQLALDVVHRHRRQTLPGIGVSLDREIVETVAQVQVRVQNQVVQRDLANLHGARSRGPVPPSRPKPSSTTHLVDLRSTDEGSGSRDLLNYVV